MVDGTSFLAPTYPHTLHTDQQTAEVEYILLPNRSLFYLTPCPAKTESTTLSPSGPYNRSPSALQNTPNPLFLIFYQYAADIRKYQVELFHPHLVGNMQPSLLESGRSRLSDFLSLVFHWLHLRHPIGQELNSGHIFQEEQLLKRSKS